MMKIKHLYLFLFLILSFGLKANEEKVIFFARMLYNSCYFDIFEKVTNKVISESYLDEIKNNPFFTLIYNSIYLYSFEDNQFH